MDINTTNENETLFVIEGLDCPDCARDLEKTIAKMDGVAACRLDFTLGKMRVAGTAAPEDIIQQVKASGHTATPADAAPRRQPKRGGIVGFADFLWARSDTRLALGGGVLLALALVVHMLGAAMWLHNALLLAAIAVAGFPIARSGVRTLIINHDLNINLLMTIATVGAVIIGETLEATVLIFLFAIGEALEGYSADRARDSLRALVSLVPEEATVIHGDHEHVVDVADVSVGALIVVKPGERIPMDGRVVAGTSAVNQAPITGESMPVRKAPDAEVFAGTVNGEGALRIEVTHRATDSTIRQVVRLVEEAQAQKAPAERFVDRFARVYTPAVVVLAAALAIVPPLLFDAPFHGAHGWLYRALALLVIACPCALVISTPVAVVSAIASAARRGVLIKGGAYLEALGRVRVFAFDKTGTLTEGRPVVTGCHTIDCADCPHEGDCPDCDDMLALAYAVERHSAHPLAKAIAVAAEQRTITRAYPAAEAVEAIAGRGVQGRVGGQMVTVGSHAMFHEIFGCEQAFCARVDAVETEGHTAMLVSDGERVLGYISVSDVPRVSSRAALAALKRLGGVETTVMLTGDNVATARAIADAVGVDDVRAGLLPRDKAEAVRNLQAQHGATAMVGDGVNDAPALAAATVGVAMGGAGSAQALETADVALMADDLGKLPYAVGLARYTNRIIKQNVAFSLGVKALFMGLAFFGAATLWMAVLADVGTSLLVTLNGMRPLRYRE